MLKNESKEKIKACEEVEHDLLELARRVRDITLKMYNCDIKIPPAMIRIIPPIQEASSQIYDQHRLLLLFGGWDDEG